jgi:APA family basic amino acid/polyamine antiporter
MSIYVIANIGYYHVLSPERIAASNALAADAVGALTGRAGATAISLLIVLSILGAMNGLILTGPRVYYEMAREGVFPPALKQVSSRYHTPMWALVIQGVWAALLASSGTYEQLFTDVIFTAWIFYGLAVAAVLVLRRCHPELERPFCVPGYPWFSLLFCAAAIGLVLSTVIERPGRALTGIGLVLSGVPVYFLLLKSWRAGSAVS